jgi:hypothetical protein
MEKVVHLLVQHVTPFLYASVVLRCLETQDRISEALGSVTPSKGPLVFVLECRHDEFVDNGFDSSRCGEISLIPKIKQRPRSHSLIEVARSTHGP